MRIIEVAFSGTVGTYRMGPVSAHILELSNRFAERGHSVTIADLASAEPRRVLRAGIDVMELPGTPESLIDGQSRYRVAKHWLRWSNYLRYLRALAARVDLSAADIVHFHSSQPAFITQQLYGIRTVYTAHMAHWSMPEPAGSSASVGEPTTRMSLSGRVNVWLERTVIRRSRLTIGLGDYLATAMPNAAVATIPNGLDAASWNLVDKRSARASLGISDGEFVVAFAARIAHIKGVDVLIEAARLLTPSVPNLKVIVVGPLSGAFDTRDEPVGHYAREMMDLAKGLPIRFDGFISNMDIRFKQHLAAADVFVLPSRVEPQGKVVLEALAMGTPVIASATGGIPPMVSADVGFLVPPGDALALAARIREAYEHPERLGAMRKAARMSVESQYSWDVMADRHIVEFRKVLGAAGLSGPE